MVLSALLSVSVASAPAQPTPEAIEQAKAAFLSGQGLYAKGLAADALARFEEAWAKRALPVTAYNIAICHEDLKRWGQAIRWYREYLRRAPDASDKKAVLATLVTLEGTLQREGTQALVIFAEPQAVQVEVDGEAIGPTPAMITVKPGTHRVVAKGPGLITGERNVEVPADTSVELSLLLKPESTSTAVRPVKGEVPLEPVQVNAPLTTLTLQADEVLKKLVRRERTAVPWVLLAAAAATSVGGVAFTVAAQDANALFLKSPANTMGSVRDLWLRQERDFRAASYVVFSVAGALALTALVLFIVESF